MPLEVEIRDGAVRTVTKGDVDYAAGMQLMAQTLREARRLCREEGKPKWPYLADIRETSERRTGDELWGIAQLLGAHLDVLSGRVAVVFSGWQYKEVLRMFGSIVERHGITFGVFDSVSDAEAWLFEGSL